MSDTRIPIQHLKPSLRFPKGGWLVRYRDEHGATLRRTLETKEKALDFWGEHRTDKRRGEFINPSDANTSFAEVAEDWFVTESHKWKPKTRAGYRQILDKHLLPELGSYPVGRINRAIVKRLLAKLAERGAKPGTQRNILRVLSPVMQHAIDANMIRANPAARIKIAGMGGKQEMPVLTADQIATLVDEIGPQYGTLVLTAAYTGIRAGELAALRVRNVDLLHRKVTVAESVAEVASELHYGPPKNGKVRTIGIPRFLAELLAEQVIGKEPGDLVFTGPQGAPLRHGTYYGKHFKPTVKRLVRSGELPREIRFHDLRHTAAAILIRQGVHPKAISDRLGHSSIAITMDLYGHLYDDQQTDIAKKLEKVYRSVPVAKSADVVAIRR